MSQRRRKKRNPLPAFDLPKEDIMKVIQIIASNAGVSPDQTVLNKEEDPDNLYTPINLLLPSLTPKVQKKMYDLLMGDQEPFFRGVINEIEQEVPSRYEEGKIPTDWLVERERRGKKSNLLRDKYNLWAIDNKDPHPMTFEEFRDKLNYEETKKKRLRRRI